LTKDLPKLGQGPTWSHSSSHDSRRRYLSDAYLEKSPIFEEREQNNNSRGRNGHRGSMFDVSSTLHKSDIMIEIHGCGTWFMVKTYHE
jgi:hypothetical protein